jgi:hypothetical protein
MISNKYCISIMKKSLRSIILRSRPMQQGMKEWSTPISSIKLRRKLSIMLRYTNRTLSKIKYF